MPKTCNCSPGGICPVRTPREGAIWSNPCGAGRNGAAAALRSRADTPGICPTPRLADSPVAARRNATYFQLTTLGDRVIQARELGVAQARVGQHAGRFENRVGDR